MGFPDFPRLMAANADNVFVRTRRKCRRFRQAVVEVIAHAFPLRLSKFFTLEAERARNLLAPSFSFAFIAESIWYGTVRSERFDSLQLRERRTKTYCDLTSFRPDSRLRAVGTMKWNFTLHPRGVSAHRGALICAHASHVSLIRPAPAV